MIVPEIPSWPRMRLMRRVWNPSMRRWRNGERGDAIGAVIGAAIEAVTVAVIVLATDLAVPSGMEEVAVDVLVPRPSLHHARLSATRRAGAAAVVVVVVSGIEVVVAAAAEVAISSEVMVEGAEGAATVSLMCNKICLRLSKFTYTS